MSALSQAVVRYEWSPEGMYAPSREGGYVRHEDYVHVCQALTALVEAVEGEIPSTSPALRRAQRLLASER